MLHHLDPTAKAKERAIAELEARLLPPPITEVTEIALKLHVHRLFCGWSAYLRKGQEQEELEEPVIDAVRDVPIWAIEKAIVVLHRGRGPTYPSSASQKYPPSAILFRSVCDAELALVRGELFQLQHGSRAPGRQSVTERDGASLEQRQSMRANLARLAAELRKNAAAEALASGWDRDKLGAKLPTASSREEAGEAAVLPHAADAEAPEPVVSSFAKPEPECAPRQAPLARTGTKG